jgi:hypothetical protein
MIRLLSVVGARPNFMKIAPIVAELKRDRSGKDRIEKDRPEKDLSEKDDPKKLPAVKHCLVHSGRTTTNFFPATSSPIRGCPSPM